MICLGKSFELLHLRIMVLIIFTRLVGKRSTDLRRNLLTRNQSLTLELRQTGGPPGEPHPGGAGRVSSCCQFIICLELEDYKTKTREREEAKINVLVQNLDD